MPNIPLSLKSLPGRINSAFYSFLRIMTLTWDEKKLGPQIDNLNIPESLNQNILTFP